MRIFKTGWFVRFSSKEQMMNTVLKDAVNQLEAGHFGADLGGGVYKQRVARPGAGKSGGYRVIICFRQGTRAFFVYGFSKSARENITSGEKRAFKEMAKELFSLTDQALNEAVTSGLFEEIESED